jgi:opacity protein-like surface antigen
VRLGYYIWKGLEFEPEFKLTSFHYSGGFNETGTLLTLNVAYNFKASPRAIPFILGGYGFGNGFPHVGFVEKLGDKVNTATLNFGAGVKFLFANIAAIRLEYRYIHLTASETGYPDEKANLHQILVGLSIFF